VGIVGATTERKRQPPYQPNARLPQRSMVRVMARQRLVNLLVSNLPGPPAPLYFAGARVREIFQIGVVQGNISVSIGALSYAGQLSFDIVGDCDATPDLAVFAGGVPDALEQLGHPGRAYGARAVARSAHTGFPGSARSSSTAAPAAASAARDVW
jgi:diacylglycerol O-acyltransferase